MCSILLPWLPCVSRRYLASVRHKLMGYFSLHSYGQMWLTPLSYTRKRVSDRSAHVSNVTVRLPWLPYSYHCYIQLPWLPMCLPFPRCKWPSTPPSPSRNHQEWAIRTDQLQLSCVSDNSVITNSIRQLITGSHPIVSPDLTPQKSTPKTHRACVKRNAR